MVTNGVYVHTPIDKGFHHAPCPIYVRIEEQEDKVVLSWSASDNNKFYANTFWRGNDCAIVKAGFNPLRHTLVPCVDKYEGEKYGMMLGDIIHKFEIPKSDANFFLHIEDNIVWIRPFDGKWWYCFVLYEADNTNNN